MPKLTLTDQQVIELLEQLPPDSQEVAFRALLKKRWPKWEELSRGGEDRLREAARQRGKNWDRMNDQEREVFIDDVLHEDRKCA